MTPHQMDAARQLVADATVRTAKEAHLLRDPEFKYRMATTLQEIMMNPEYPKEFVAAVAAVAMMMLVEQVGSQNEDLL